MFKMLTNITKAALNVVIAPVAVAIDVVTLPASAYNDTDPFARTEKRLKAAGKAIDQALRPD